MQFKWKALLAGIIGLALVGPAMAASCSSEQLAAEVDRAGAQLRTFNANNMQAMDASLRELQKRRGWQDSDHIERVTALFHTPEIAAIDRESFNQYSAIEDLSDGPAGPVDCARLVALRARVQDLLATMTKKREAMRRIISAELAPPPTVAAPEAAAEPMAKAPAAPARAEVAKLEKPAVAAKGPVKPASRPVATAKMPDTGPAEADWKANAALDPAAAPALPAIGAMTVAGIPAPYSVDEIKAASQGFFGDLTAQMASVIAHSFESVGAPNGYIMGDEGGGAFLAGLRYGTGKLYLKDGTEQRVYWRGPSIGFDVGASGARTLFLVYNLKKAQDAYAVMSGVDGSAYVIGGAGMTLLTDGQIVMAPISTGLGLRLGANAGYLRFSAKQSWLPF